MAKVKVRFTTGLPAVHHDVTGLNAGTHHMADTLDEAQHAVWILGDAKVRPSKEMELHQGAALANDGFSVFIFILSLDVLRKRKRETEQ